MPISKTFPLPALSDVNDDLDPISGNVLTWNGDEWIASAIDTLPIGNGDPTERFRWKLDDAHPTWDTAALINVRDLGAVGDGGY